MLLIFAQASYKTKINFSVIVFLLKERQFFTTNAVIKTGQMTILGKRLIDYMTKINGFYLKKA